MIYYSLTPIACKKFGQYMPARRSKGEKKIELFTLRNCYTKN